MAAAPDRLALPARRRRHARLIAALTRLIGACADAANAVYEPVAAAPPGQEAVEVLLLPCVQVSHSAALLLDRARAEGDARWPAAVARERKTAQRTYAARCAVAAAQEAAEQAGARATPRWREDPLKAAAWLRELAAGGEHAVDEVLDEAVDAEVVAGLLALQKARTASDPSTAAELCLAAVPHIALAVHLAGTDLG